MSCKILQRGAIAQLVARLHGMQEVRGSNPRSSTISYIYFQKLQFFSKHYNLL